MPGLSFLSKKSWHTSNLNNQEKVWLAEQQAANEDRKLAELREQIKVEREREEFEKLTNKNVVGDRGTNWMYEGGYAAGVGGEDGEETTRIKEEEATHKNEAYLLGKEYVPEGKSGHTGDFVEAATMTGALEKASTYGAFSTDNSNTTNGGGDRMKHLRIHQEEDTSSEAVVAANEEVQKEKDWSKEFHLRHEDPMFAVHRRRQAQLREVEKKKRLMERAGLDVSVVTKLREYEGIDDGQRNNESSQPDDYDVDNRRRDRKRRSTDEKKKRRKRSSRNEEKKHHRHSKSKIDHRTRDRSLSSSSPSYSSSSSFTSSGYRRRRDREKDDRRSRRSEKVDDRNGNSRRRERSRSRSSDNRQTIRRRDSEKKDNDYYYDNDRRNYYDDQKEDGQRRTQHGHYESRNNDYDDDARGRRDDCKPTSHNSNNNTRGKAGEDIRGRYGLVGTSLSSTNSNNGNMTKHKVEHPERNSSTYLGPDMNLIESKRRIENEERERLRHLSHKGHRR